MNTQRSDGLDTQMNTITTGRSTLTSMLRALAETDPDGRAYTCLAGGNRELHMTYGELDRRARATACRLWRLGVGRARGTAGQRSRFGAEPTVLVTLPTGLDFLSIFFGCLYAGAVAVPTRYPHPKRPLVHVEGIAADSAAPVGFTSREMQAFLAERLDATRWLVADDVELSWANDWEDPDSSPSDVAYLQYTSGSTSAPKGVLISHKNVLSNCEDLSCQWEIGPADRILSWVPHFHDMGLVFGLLTPLYVGCHGVFMPPMAFAQRPLTWLEAISRYRVTHSAAPNFAYQLSSRIPDSQLAGLDLSCWRMAANGAEPVRADTVERFIRRYEAYGFSPGAMCPGYGLAENTLMATTSRPGSLPVIRSVDAAGLREGRFEPVFDDGRATRLAASGTADGRSRVVIVDPDSHVRCQPGKVGEVWVAGPSVAGGYWQRPDVSAKKFGAHLADTGEGAFLRTGDLGVVHDGNLFVLGRSDDLIIIRGANYAPEDIELAVEECDPALEPDGGAVFAVDLLGEPRLVVAHEVRRQARRDLDRDGVVRSILRAVSEQCELEVSAVVLLGARTLPRTSSGKKQRHACRARTSTGRWRVCTCG